MTKHTELARSRTLRGALLEGRSRDPVIAEAGACSINTSVVTNRSTTIKQYVGLDVSLDPHGIAQIVRVGWYREIAVKSTNSHAIRAVLVARAPLITRKVKLTNCV